MEATFWHERWARSEIGFHQAAPNRLFSTHIDRLGLSPGARVFLPLCGKTLDIGWLIERGHRVVGIELNGSAVDQLFEELGVSPDVGEVGPLSLYRAAGIDIFVGDVFDLDAATLGSVDAVYDRAALVALPEETRPRYANHLRRITNAVPQFLICFDYDQSVMDGPPFAVPGDAVHALYGEAFEIETVASLPVPGGLKGTVDAQEEAWILRAR